jgi:outer membrane protein assembly factor BamE (lipoprotein component of BamABCDE complex)
MRMALLAATVALTACSSSSAVTPEKIAQIKPAMKLDQVEALLGRPAHIDQSETTGVTGQVYYYATPQGEGRVTFLNDTVFKAEFIPGASKS